MLRHDWMGFNKSVAKHRTNISKLKPQPQAQEPAAPGFGIGWFRFRHIQRDTVGIGESWPQIYPAPAFQLKRATGRT